MDLDLLITDASLPDGRRRQDIACKDGRIVGIEPAIGITARRVIDAKGRLVAPPFVEPHFHLDATLSAGRPRHNSSGTLLEGIALWGELKRVQTADEIVERALAYCDLAVAQGILAVRSHVDVSDEDAMRGVEALLHVRSQVAPYLDLQLVAFPQDGHYRTPDAEVNLERALDLGVDVVGGIPHFERTMERGTSSVDACLRLAAERGLRVDLHCDETDDPHSRHIETVAHATQTYGLQGLVNASHVTSMHSMDNYYVSKLLPLMAEARLSVIANPLINIVIQGRHDTYPKRRGMTRVSELRDHGIDVAFGGDCILDPWYPLGQACMLEVASMGLHVAHMTGIDDMRWCFDAVTVNAASILGLEKYGLAVGNHADMVLLQASDPVEAIRLKATRLAVIRRGHVIAETPERRTALKLKGRPGELKADAVAAFAHPLT